MKMIGRRAIRRYLLVLFSVWIFLLIRLPYLSMKNWLINENIRICLSSNLSAIVMEKKIESLCSIRATERGVGQKIISISFFGPVENPAMFPLNNSLRLLKELINEMQQIYSDEWILRIYHDEKILYPMMISQFEHRYDRIDFCNVTEIGWHFLPPRFWRFLPSIDKTVNIMASRDLDSPLTPRERAAIDEWILSNLTFHSMRDHPYHAAPMMAGMWAFRVELDRDFSQVIRSKLLDCYLISQYSLNLDQQFLADHLWPYAMNKAMSHASYWCTTPGWNEYHRPFPTQRPMDNVTNYCFVGCPKPCYVSWNLEKEPCPSECRPKEHQDWIYC